MAEAFFNSYAPSHIRAISAGSQPAERLNQTVVNAMKEADINISSMHLGRLKSRGQALMVLALDEPLSEKQLQQVLAAHRGHFELNTVILTAVQHAGFSGGLPG